MLPFPMAPAKLRVLHLSDLHISVQNKSIARERIKALIETFETQEHPNLVFFTGDATDRGKPDEYKLFDEYVVGPLTKAFSLGRDKFFIVPGNHDVDRSRIPPLIEPGVR